MQSWLIAEREDIQDMLKTNKSAAYCSVRHFNTDAITFKVLKEAAKIVAQNVGPQRATTCEHVDA